MHGDVKSLAQGPPLNQTRGCQTDIEWDITPPSISPEQEKPLFMLRPCH